MAARLRTRCSLLAALVATALAACSGDDGASDPSADPSASETDGGPTKPRTSPSDDQGETDAGVPAPVGPSDDAGADAGSDPDPFAGAAAYAAKLGPTTRQTAHPFTNDNPAGKPCLSCHDGTGKAPKMAFGGTVWAAATGPTGAGKVEVRVKDATGKAISAWTDADGNFFSFVSTGGDLTFPAHPGLRNAKGQRLMTSVTHTGDCNSCHVAAKSGRLIAPK